jgi:ABC-type polysaccharide/polyol phosphate export permease
MTAPKWKARNGKGGTMAMITADKGRMGEDTLFSFLRNAGSMGLAELMGGLRHWRVWHLLGIRELRHRYSRSKLGQVWLTLSTAIMIGVLGGVWSVLFNQPVRDLLPFIGTSLIFWTYLSQILTESTAAFINHGNLYRNQKMNFSVSIYSVIYRNTLVLAHSLAIIVVLIVAFGVPINWYLLQAVPAFALTWIMLAWVGYLIAMACVRYRDIIQIITTWLTVSFFATPVMWRPNQITAKYQFIVDYNPLAQYLELLRNPFLGEPVGAWAWVTTTAISFGAGLLALAVIGRYQRRVIYWM